MAIRTKAIVAAIIGVFALVASGCGLHLPPELTDCRSWGCPDGQVCLATEGAWKCVVDKPAPEPTPTPTPTPEPTPAPDPCSACPAGTATCVVDGAGKVSCLPEPPPVSSSCLYPVQESDLLSVGAVGATRIVDVRAGERVLGDLRDPRRPGYVVARENNRKLAGWLRGNGLCAFAGQEAIFVLSVDHAWEEYHAAAETDGGWTQDPYRFNHRPMSPLVPKADPDAPALEVVCGEPAPPPLSSFVVHQKDIRDGWEKFDVTPVNAEGNRAYCDTVGFVNRNSCPARAEWPAWRGGDRLACERVMLRGAAPLFMWTGGPGDGYVRDGTNGFTFEHRKGSVGELTVCDAVGEKCQHII